MTAQDPPAFRFFNEVSIIDQLVGTLFERGLPKGMTRAQFGILNHFVRLGHEAQSPAQLASAFQVTRPTMTSTLARLERAGLVAIRPDPDDGRGKLVSLTPQGQAMREHCIAAAANLAPLFGALAADAEFEAALPLLQRIRAALDAAR